MSETKDLATILNAKIPIVVIESHDEERVLALLLRFAMQRALSFYEWRVTRGLELGGFGAQPNNSDDHTEPETVLRHITTTPGPAMYVLCDFHPYLRADSPTNIRLLKDTALAHDSLHNTIVLVSHELDVPAELGRLSAKLQLRLPSDEELTGLVRQEAKRWAEQHAGENFCRTIDGKKST